MKRSKYLTCSNPTKILTGKSRQRKRNLCLNNASIDLSSIFYLPYLISGLWGVADAHAQQSLYEMRYTLGRLQVLHRAPSKEFNSTPFVAAMRKVLTLNHYAHTHTHTLLHFGIKVDASGVYVLFGTICPFTGAESTNFCSSDHPIPLELNILSFCGGYTIIHASRYDLILGNLLERASFTVFRL